MAHSRLETHTRDRERSCFYEAVRSSINHLYVLNILAVRTLHSNQVYALSNRSVVQTTGLLEGEANVIFQKFTWILLQQIFSAIFNARFKTFQEVLTELLEHL